MCSSRIPAFFALCAALLLPACQRQEPPAPQVVRRVGAEGDAGLEPAVEFTRFRLFDTTRWIARVAPASSHALILPAGARGISFAHALTAEGKGRAEVEFRLVLSSAGTRRVLYSSIAASDAGDWREGVVALGAGAEPARLLVETEPQASARGRLVRPFWGSILVLGEAPEAKARAPARFDNVVLVSLDTLGANYVGGFGSDLGLTPRLDDLRRRAFTFRRAYSSYPSTRPSHASLLSGLHPRRHRAFGFTGALAVRLINEDLAEAGWHTAGITENGYIASVFGFERGFDAYGDGLLGFAGDAARTFDQALEWLRRAGEVPHRFFLLVHTYEVHSPYIAEDDASRALAEELDPGYGGPRRFAFDSGPFETPHNSGRQPLPDSELRRMRALHMAEVRRQDEILGRFVAAFEALPAFARTLLVITSDHGEEFGEQGFIGHGETLHNRALHVPLVLAGRGIAAGESERVVQLVDVVPTIRELLGLPPLAAVDGASLVPLLDGRSLPPRPAFSEAIGAPGDCLRHGEQESCKVDRRAVQDDRWKLVTSRLPPQARLFDLASDPEESRDVSADFPAERLRLEEHLAAYEALQPGADAAAATPRLDADTIERLRLLGYTD